jgi:molybdopterin-guanine dinucleotide biosynthesis protein A
MLPTHKHLLEISGIILAGGKSQRMGEDKAFIQIGEKPIIETIIDLFQKVFKETLIITNRKDSYLYLKVGVYEDIFPEQGALGGLYTGLFRSHTFNSFVAACDMPFLNEGVINFVCQQADGYDVVVPRTEDGFQPLHALYSKRCLGPIEALLREEKTRIVDLYPRVRVRVVDFREFLSVDPEMQSFVNINTPEELNRLKIRKAIP